MERNHPHQHARVHAQAHACAADPCTLLQVIIRSFREACALAVKKLDNLSVHLDKSDPAKQRDMLEKSAATSLSSKLVSGHKEFFAKMVRSRPAFELLRLQPR